ncbi:MAG: AbrB family transcriptional regulator [Deltaproteobacteria bacterium]|nr:AbrB family transcriptional regulator [Deltaproteobacteria bacterium]
MKIRLIILTFCVAAPAGFLFHFLRFPLPWLLGPLAATLLFNSYGGGRACWPVGLRNLGLIVIGYSMGRTVTDETARQILADLPEMAIVTLLTLIFGAGIGYVAHRRTGISLASSTLGFIPGGLAQMVLLTEEIKDTDLTVVTFLQTVRLMAVVFIVPFVATYSMVPGAGGQAAAPMAMQGQGLVAALPAVLAALAGALVAVPLKLPIPYLLGPVFGSAAVSLGGYPAPPVPYGLLSAAQIFFGISMGTGITLNSLRQLGRVSPYAIGGSIVLVVFTFLLGFGLTFFTPLSLLTAFLSTAPGGTAEMGITAVALHADIATVLAYQLMRLFSILILVPPFLKWWFNR